MFNVKHLAKHLYTIQFNYISNSLILLFGLNRLIIPTSQLFFTLIFL